MPTPIQIAALHAVVPAAQAAQRKWGVPASVTLAQWITESSWGTSQLAVKAHNYFGIKAQQPNVPETYAEFPTDEYEQGRKVLVEALFQKFADEAASFDAHAKLLATAARYKAAMAQRDNPQAFCAALQKAFYSSSPRYAVDLMILIRSYKLTQYDLPTPPPAGAQEIAA